ncbi:ATP-binding cassette domain-containing protein [Actinomycetes bacterium NPDC127524]
MIEVKNVSKKYGRKTVLEDISFTAEKGDITCLIGINGVGKTTTLKAIMGLTPYKGEITIDQKKLDKNSYEKITYVPDAITMLPSMNIYQAFDFMKDYYSSWNVKKADELLDFFKLKKEMRISELSKGNTSKLNLLLGLALDVDYILMDEPFSGIDMFSREHIADVFASSLIEDKGVIITTHEIGDIEHLIDKAVLIEYGKVIKEFKPEDLRFSEGKSVVDVMREVYQQ